MLARIGGVCATTMSSLDDQVPPILFGSAAFVAALLTAFFLPETGGRPLPEDVEDIKAREEEDSESAIWPRIKNLIHRKS